MPTYRTGNMWDESHNAYDPPQIFLATTNNVIVGDSLVMGAGSAFEMTQRFYQAERKFAAAIRQTKNPKRYLLVCTGKYGIIQTKYHYRDPSPLELVADSLSRLSRLAELFPTTTIHCPFPGIGLGGLREAIVKPYLDGLVQADNVHIWTYQ